MNARKERKMRIRVAISENFCNFARLKCSYTKNETIKDSEKYHEP